MQKEVLRLCHDIWPISTTSLEVNILLHEKSTVLRGVWLARVFMTSKSAARGPGRHVEDTIPGVIHGTPRLHKHCWTQSWKSLSITRSGREDPGAQPTAWSTQQRAWAVPDPWAQALNHWPGCLRIMGGREWEAANSHKPGRWFHLKSS